MQRLKAKEDSDKLKKRKSSQGKNQEFESYIGGLEEKENAGRSKITSQRKVVKKKLEDSDESEDVSEDFEPEEEDNFQNVEEMLEEIENEEKDIQEITRNICDKALEDWVLVKFPTKKVVKYYVGQVIELDPLLVKFARKSSFHKKIPLFRFPIVEDISQVLEEDIVKLLPCPKLGRRGEISFEISFDGFDIQ